MQQIKNLKYQLQITTQDKEHLELELEEKVNKYSIDVELGKQRENKLMFFLYVLKEEKKCPVTEVFENYIKPIETSRFTTDYGEDYKRVLKKIKKQSKYEKIYNRALKKMRIQHYNKDYKSDSCIPINNLIEGFNKTLPNERSNSLKHLNPTKQFIKIKNKSNTISMPVLPVNMQVKQYGNKHRTQ